MPSNHCYLNLMVRFLMQLCVIPGLAVRTHTVGEHAQTNSNPLREWFIITICGLGSRVSSRVKPFTMSRTQGERVSMAQKYNCKLML